MNKKKINVLILEHSLLSNVAWWRTYRPLWVVSKLSDEGLFPVEFNFRVKRKDLDYSDMWWAHLIIVSRPFAKPYISDFLVEAKQNGCKVIVDIDDDVFNLPKTHALYSAYKPGSANQKEIEKAFKSADLFWFSTPKFLETYTNQGVVIPNAIFPEEIPAQPAPDRGHWAWRGTTIQYHDILAQDARKWYEENRDKAKKWFFLGVLPPMDHAENAELLDYIESPRQYMEAIHRAQFNGFWKPLMDHQFNEHKSNIALIEATMSGGACITNFAGRPGWETATDTFPTYEKACELWQASKELISTKYNLWNTAQMRAQTMHALCSPQTATSPNTDAT